MNSKDDSLYFYIMFDSKDGRVNEKERKNVKSIEK